MFCQIVSTKTTTAHFETQSRPLQTIECYNPQNLDSEYGIDAYRDNSLYDQQTLHLRSEDYPPTDEEVDLDFPDNRLSRAPFEFWQANPETNISEEKKQSTEKEPQTELGLLTENAFVTCRCDQKCGTGVCTSL